MESIKFTEAENPELAQEVYRIRYNIFTKKLHWFEDSDTEIERDYYDGLDRTFYIVLRKHKVIVGMARCIVGSPSLTEELAGRLYKSENHLCVSRMWFAKGYNTFMSNIQLGWSIMQVWVEQDVEWFIGCTYEGFVKQQVKFRLDFPVWLEKDINGEKATFYESKVPTLANFLNYKKAFL